MGISAFMSLVGCVDNLWIRVEEEQNRFHFVPLCSWHLGEPAAHPVDKLRLLSVTLRDFRSVHGSFLIYRIHHGTWERRGRCEADQEGEG
jgi:hypothetical protein